MNKHKEFIKECYEGKHGILPTDLKEVIENRYPEFKEEEFKVGDWVIGWIDEKVIRLNHKINYGFETSYSYIDGIFQEISNSNIHRKASKKEIESHLIEEALRKGFKEGVCVSAKNFGSEWYSINELNSSSFEYRGKESGLDQLSIGSYAIYRNGQWAEIIPTMTKKEAEEKLNCKIL